MGFTSNTYGQTIYSGNNVARIINPPAGFSKGYVQRDYTAHPCGSYRRLPEFPRNLYIPRNEWRARCEELEKTGSLVSQKLRKRKVPPKNQASTSYCWINCVVAAMETRRCISGLPYISFSPASAGAPIKGYRNVGGWPAEGAEYIMENGVAPSSVWPDNAIQRSYDNAESREARKAHKIELAYDLPDKDFDALFSCLLLGYTCPIGLLWWMHAVEAVDPLCLGGDDFGIRIKNSWGDWEDEGYGILSENKGTPDDGLVIVGAS